MHLFYTTRSAYHPEGRQAKSVNHRTDYEGQMEIQWLPDINLVVTDWANNGGLGSPQRFFRPLLGGQPVGLSPHRRPQGVQMRESGPAGGKQTE